ncbi:choline transporter-like protein 1 isoform X3 [Mizuhopecten yessoensis]|uniref:choline transporter-like protein 1 isoform X3 n=1 Tax=Mizuhopecten yessoensis TaxID=6573 RepID=UPI000B45A3A1|nr:choline transporter-like protein 1 isoform X3 [Mizuhopecten yessoensis]
MCGCCCAEEAEESTLMEQPEEKRELTNPIKNRGCTDIIVLLIFILFWAGMIYIAVFSVMHGDAFRLVYGYDSFGNTCDEDNTGRSIPNVSLSGMNMKSRSFVFFMDISNPSTKMSLCVNKCPDYDLKSINEVRDFSQSEGSILCRYDINFTDYNQAKIDEGSCPQVPVLASIPLLNRCVPKHLTKLANQTLIRLFDSLNDSDLFQKVLSDLYTSWKEMMVLCFVALGFAVLMVLLIRFFAAFIVWVIMALAIVGSVVATVFLWWTYADIKSDMDLKKETKRIPLLDVEVDNEKAFLIFSIIATVLTVILLLILLVMRKRIALVVTLFKEAGECVQAMPCLLIQPLWTFLILILFFVYWVIILAYLSTSEIPSLGENNFVRYDEHETVSYLWWYHLIGLIWTSEFIIACQQLVISGAVATWYFARDKSTVSCPLCKSISLLVFHHLGSVAFGAFIITMVKLPRMILMYLQKKFKGSENQCAQYCLKCCICCLWCLEKCLKYLNQNAYTVVAIRGTNFCSSAKKAFLTLFNNALRVVAINSVGDFILMLGKIGVMAATAAVGIIWLKDKEGLHYYPVPVLLTCVFAFFVAHCFLSIYEMVIDAIFLCFCEDVDMNDGSPERRYYASPSLHKYIEESSKKLNELTREGTVEETEPARL